MARTKATAILNKQQKENINIEKINIRNINISGNFFSKNYKKLISEHKNQIQKLNIQQLEEPEDIKEEIKNKFKEFFLSLRIVPNDINYNEFLPIDKNLNNNFPIFKNQIISSELISKQNLILCLNYFIDMLDKKKKKKKKFQKLMKILNLLF